LKNILATALALRETVVRPSISPSLPKITCIHAISCITLSFIHILCPDNVALRGNVTVLSGDVEPCPLATLIVRPGKIIKKSNNGHLHKWQKNQR
jgi:hypothetical protein